MLEQQFIKLFSLPKVKIISKRNLDHHIVEFDACKTTDYEVCPKCATKSFQVYDHVWVKIKDTLFRDKM